MEKHGKFSSEEEKKAAHETSWKAAHRELKENIKRNLEEGEKVLREEEKKIFLEKIKSGIRYKDHNRGIRIRRTIEETAFGWAYDNETKKFEQWAKESEKSLEIAKEWFLEILKMCKGRFIGVQEKEGLVPLYLAKAGKQYKVPSLASYYTAFVKYERDDVAKELVNGGSPIFDNDIVQQGEIISGIEYYGGYAYDFCGETIAETRERGGYDDLKEICTLFDMPILKRDLNEFISFARRMSRNFNTNMERAGRQRSFPEDIQQAIEILKKKE